LCGESHQDAIDVTRRGGIFEAKEGWVETTRQDLLKEEGDDGVLVKVLGSATKLMTLQKAKDWAKERAIEEFESREILLLWVEQDNSQGQGGRVTKGKAHLVAWMAKEEFDDSEDDGRWIDPTVNDKELSTLPVAVREWVLGGLFSTRNGGVKAFQWRDLDAQAYALNQRRLSDEDIPEIELDEIVCQRKQTLKTEDGIWTWDDWFSHIHAKNVVDNHDNVDMHLILEASIPPWELSLHRPKVSDETCQNINLIGPAADCIRCLEEDEEGDEEDEFDPSNDGVGSYLDFVYRRFMEEIFHKSSSTDAEERSAWLHCVDMRDLGCQAACHSKSVQKLWTKLLTPEEYATLNNDEENKFLELKPDSRGEFIEFVPENRMNPERLYHETLRSEGRLVHVEDGSESESSDDGDDEDDGFTYPSFEGFFGQNTDFLYYSKHVRLAYSPFLAKCVQSLETWDKFFTNLFLGGTIKDALSLLKLDECTRQYVYVRSPILKLGDDSYRHRDDGEHYITYPFFPFLFYLFAKNTSPPRTWSSSLFNKLCDDDNAKDTAVAARDWTLQKIRCSSLNPKDADDPECGGEWFEAYLYAVHRDIYDDIDISDATALLKKNKMKSLNSNRKYNIGRIRIPSCQEGFEEILQAFSTGPSNEKITDRSEVLAKILIDIYMSCLVDFSTILKVVDIASSSSKSKVVIVLYMGTAHTRAVSDFFLNRMSFRRKAFIGKFDWDDDECRSLRLPGALWNFNDLFQK